MGTVASVSQADRARLTELEHELADLRRSAHSSSVMQKVNDLLRTDFSASWRFERDHDRMFLDDVARSSSLVPASYFDTLSAGLRSGEMGFLFSTRVPERAQRNRPVVIEGAESGRAFDKGFVAKLGLSPSAFKEIAPALHRTIDLHARYGVHRHYQLRTLVCEGPLVICYLNTIHEGPFSARQRRLYASAVRLLRRRKVIDHHLATTQGLKAALDVALDALGRAAFILNRRGAITHANPLGSEAVDRERSLPVTLAHEASRQAAGYATMPIEENGVARAYLVVKRSAELTEISSTIATQLALGERARTVFALAAAGESTKNIATRLGLAENTVEYHLTRIYRALGIRSRAELHQLLLDRALGKRAT